MKDYQVPFSEVVSILADYKRSLTEDGILSPFRDASDGALSRAAGSYLRNHIQRQQRHRSESVREPFKEMLRHVGFKVADMSEAEFDDLTEEMDDLYLRLANYVDQLLQPVDGKLAWHVVSVEMDWDAETLHLVIGEDYRVRAYHELVAVKSIVVPKNVKELSDLDGILNAFDAFVEPIFQQIESPAIYDELKQAFIERIARINR